MRKGRLTAAIAAMLMASRATAAGPAPLTGPTTLGVTSPAPALALTHWYKGTPIKTFEPGRVYVIEFWATWCVPCKASIPHLTELQKKFGDKVTIIGVDVWEQPDENTDAAIADLARPFVEKMGDQMAYAVAGDGAAGLMDKAWLQPAVRIGIPSAFVIDGKGTIAWIGHPASMEPVLDQVLAGTWDAAAEKKKVDQVRVDRENAPETRSKAKLLTARDAGDTAAVLATLAEIDKAYAGLAADPDVITAKTQALLRTDAAAAVSYVRAMAGPEGAFAKRPALCWAALRAVPPEKESLLTPAQWKAIAAVIDPANAPGKGKNAPAYSAYAELMRRAGDRDKAIVFQRKAVGVIQEKMDEQTATFGKPSKANADLLKAEQAKLEMLIVNTGKAGAS